MIFLTVGTQGPFDRLVRAVDDWAGQCGQTDVFAQIGPTDYVPKHIDAKQFIHPAEFRRMVQVARVVVAHAGMGSIITALEFGKQIIVMPRRCELREQRNDHQLATARRLSEQGLVQAAVDENDLRCKLDRIKICRSVEPLSAGASASLLASVRAFIESGALPSRPASR